MCKIEVNSGLNKMTEGLKFVWNELPLAAAGCPAKTSLAVSDADCVEES